MVKTHKAVAKRFKVTKNKKVTHRACGQDHFNKRQSGTKIINKRRDRTVSKADQKTILTAMHH